MATTRVELDGPEVLAYKKLLDQSSEHFQALANLPAYGRHHWDRNFHRVRVRAILPRDFAPPATLSLAQRDARVCRPRSQFRPRMMRKGFRTPSRAPRLRKRLSTLIISPFVHRA